MTTAEKNTKPLDEAQARTFFHAAYLALAKVQDASSRRVRTRILLLCLLCRYAGMRISEALQFRGEEDLDAERNVLVHGRWQRRIPLSADSAAQINTLCTDPCLMHDKGRICRMDQGYVRRSMEKIGRHLGIRVNPTVLRRTRESELLRMGVPSDLAQRFLGNAAPEPDGEERKLLRQIFRRWEEIRRVGRHNSFRGTVKSIRKASFSCTLHIATEKGMCIAAHCTMRAVNAMNLEPGSEVVATFRSLQVEFLGAAQEPNATVIEASESEECPPNAPSASASPCSSAYAMAKTPEVGLLPSQKPDIPDDNVFSAIVEEIWQGETEAKILLSLAGGSVTMILPNNVLSIAPGQLVRIRIAPEAVDVRSMPGMRIEKT